MQVAVDGPVIKLAVGDPERGREMRGAGYYAVADGGVRATVGPGGIFSAAAGVALGERLYGHCTAAFAAWSRRICARPSRTAPAMLGGTSRHFAAAASARNSRNSRLEEV